jgi:hypothetical protein
MAISKPVYEDEDSIDEQIRSSAAERSAGKTMPTIEADEEAPAPTPEKTAAKMPMRPGQASSGSKTPIVTKEQLAASGLSLRDYLNKQQGLTRRGDSSASARMPTRPGQEAPTYSNEGRSKPKVAASGVDLTSPMSALRSLARGPRRGGGSNKIAANMGIDSDTLLPNRMAKGGSVSSASKRADGCAQRGKTRGMMK